MPLRILITGTSAAVSQVTKTIIDRSLHNCKSEIVDYKQLSLSAEKADYDFAVINDLMADVYYRLPSALNDVPSVLITNNDRILNDPKRFGLFGAIKNTSGGAAGLVAFEKELIAIINNGTHNTLPINRTLIKSCSRRTAAILLFFSKKQQRHRKASGAI